MYISKYNHYGTYLHAQPHLSPPHEFHPQLMEGANAVIAGIPGRAFWLSKKWPSRVTVVYDRPKNYENQQKEKKNRNVEC